MADAPKILGQAIPAAAVQATLYTVPAATSTVVSCIVVCNQSAATTFRIRVNIAGAADAASQFLAFDTPLGANQSITWVIGLSLATTDVVKVQSASGSVSFIISGVEIT